ncbi:MAG: imidazolonepropionase, partial [Actinobacteria bacterium]|nr:imidazolonepropionase [Actinomycetota bacterium]
MSRTLVDNIGLLVTNDLSVDGSPLGVIENAAFIVEDEIVTWVGASGDVSHKDVSNTVDAHGRCVIPGFVDSHSHLVFAGD